MNLHDRLRDELHHRSANMEVSGAGSRSVITAARTRTRRARSLGVAAVVLLVGGVGGVALTLRDSPTDLVATTQTDGAGTAGGDNISAATAPGDSGTGGSTDGSDQPPEGTADSGQRAEVATTELSDSDDGAGEVSPEPEETAETSLAPAANVGPKAVAQIAHNGGFVALQEGASLEFSSDLVTWTAVADPRPVSAASISRMASYNAVLYVAGVTPGAGSTQPWLAKSSNLSSWQQISVPAPSDDGSPLTEITNILYSMDVGANGIIVTGETLVTLDIARLLSPEVIAADAWTLGDNQGDLTKIVVYDPTTGSPVDEIDLLAEGVPEATLAILANGDPTPFVAVTNSVGALEPVVTNLDPGTVISGAFIVNGEFIASGFSSRFASRVLWSSMNGQTWEELPVSVIGDNQSQMAGDVGGRVVAFTGQGPILTVQYRDGDTWSEVRLDRLFGNRNDQYQIVAAAFGSGGVVAVAATFDQSQNETLYVLLSPDGANWTIGLLSDLTPTGLQIIGVDSVAIGASAVVGYERSDATHERVILQTD